MILTFLYFLLCFRTESLSKKVDVLLNEMGSRIKRNLTSTLPVETHVLIDPLVQEVIYYSYPILNDTQDKMIKEYSKVNVGNSKMEFVKKYADLGSNELLMKLGSFPKVHGEALGLRKRNRRISKRNIFDYIKKNLLVTHIFMSVALVVVAVYFIMLSVYYLMNVLDQATLMDELYKTPWIFNNY